jgi:hypothetical protein
MSDVTRILEAVARGDHASAEELLPLVYQELRKLAAHKMAGQAPGHTLQPTALVHEAWLRLAGNEPGRFAGRAHFFAAAAEAIWSVFLRALRVLLGERVFSKMSDFGFLHCKGAASGREMTALINAQGPVPRTGMCKIHLASLRLRAFALKTSCFIEWILDS